MNEICLKGLKELRKTSLKTKWLKFREDIKELETLIVKAYTEGKHSIEVVLKEDHNDHSFKEYFEEYSILKDVIECANVIYDCGEPFVIIYFHSDVELHLKKEGL